MGEMSGMVAGLTPRPPLQHLERGWRARTGGRGLVLDCGFRRNDGTGGGDESRPTKTYPCQPYGPPLRRGDVDSRLRGNDGGRGVVAAAAL